MTHSTRRPRCSAPDRPGPPPEAGANLLDVVLDTASPGVTVCSVCGELDLATAPALLRRLADVERSRPARLIVDLTQCAFASVAAMRLLLDSCQHLMGRGDRVDVVAAGEPARRVLALCGATARLVTYQSLSDAVEPEPVASTVDDDQMDLAALGSGLRFYVHQVAAGLGIGPEATWCELADQASAYIALDDPAPDWPGRDAALVWDNDRGWALAVETHSGEDLLMQAYYGPQLVPRPDQVASFARAALTRTPRSTMVARWAAGRPSPRCSVGELGRRLLPYVEAGIGTDVAQD